MVRSPFGLSRQETTKLIWTAAVMFFIVYIHHMLRIAKDALVISHLGTEAISAIKIWGIFPATLLLVLLYIKVTDLMTRSRLFNTVIWSILSYFILFALFIYPQHQQLTLKISERLTTQLPALTQLFKIVSNWHYSLFYIFSEMWSTFVLSISFWQAANHITNVNESKKLYPFFGLVANFSPLLAGILSKMFITPGNNWQPTLNRVTLAIVVAGLILTVCLRCLKHAVGAEIFNGGTVNIKKKTPILTHLKYIASSRYMLMILILMLGYFISLNLIEGVWKKMLEAYCAGDANQIHYIISDLDIGISIFSVLLSLASFYIIRYCKFITCSLITPLAMLLTGGFFFFLILFPHQLSFLGLKGSNFMVVTIYLGAITCIIAKSAKHSLFDTMKEILYIPLPQELKVKGKAAVEAIGTRCGKSTGAFIQQGLLMLFPTATLLSLSPIIAVILCLTLSGWIYSTFSLDRLMKKLQHNK